MGLSWSFRKPVQSLQLLLLLATLVFSLLEAPTAQASNCLPVAGADLRGCDFSGVKLEQMDLSGADFTGANLRYTSFGGSNLSNAKLIDVDISYANFTGAIVNGLVSGSVLDEWRSAVLPGFYSFQKGFLVGPGANLSNQDLSWANLVDTNLRGTNFRGANLSGAQFAGSDVQGADFEGASFTRVQSGRLVGAPASLPTGFNIRSGFFVGPDARIAGDLSGVSFAGLALDRADFTRSNLSGANFYGASLHGAKVAQCNLDNANFLGADLAGLQSGSVYGTPVALPNDWTILNGFLAGPGADLSGADLSYQVISGLNLSGANLDNTQFLGSTISNSNLSYSSMIGTRLTSAYLYSVDVHGATLRVDFSHTSVVGLRSGGIVDGRLVSGSPRIVLRGGYYIGPAANLQGADLSGLDLSGVILQDANLTGATLEGANLSGAWLEKADFSGANLKNANLTDTGLTGANLSRADMQEADLSRSTLGFSNLDATNMSGANLTTATGSGIIGTPLNFPDSVDIRNGVLKPIQTLAPAPLISGNARPLETLKVEVGSWHEGANTSIQWLRDGTPIAEASKDSYQLLGSDVSHQISVQVTGVESGFWDCVKVSAAVAVLPGTLTSTPTPVISGLAETARVLSVDEGYWDDGVVKRYQWLRNGQAIPGAITSVYQVSPADVGNKLSIRILASKLGFNNVTLDSAQVVPQQAAITSSVPQIIGEIRAKKTVTASVSSWVSGVTISYQWFLDGRAIRGATKARYTITAAQKGHKLSVRATLAKPGFKECSKSSSSAKVK